MKKAIRINYSGKVQGVGFRFTVKRIADKYGLNGWVKNLPNGKVEAVFQGEELNLESCLKGIELYFKDNIIDIKLEEEACVDLFGFQIRYY